jgi:ribosomal protein S18 acetylase RimI-like enzyme
MRDPVELCVDAASGWHGAWLDALGLPWARERATWRALDRPPQIYFAGITLEPGVGAAEIASVPGSICDSWQSLDLEPHGFRVWRTEPWFHRPPGPLPNEPAPPELQLVQVSSAGEVYELEAVSVRGFGSEGDVIAPGTFHPPAVLGDERMHMFLGRVDGRPVAASMGYRTDNVVGVFGVTTVASARRRGYGTAVTRAAMLVETGLPSILAPSPMAARLYQRLGFEHVGELSIWSTSTEAPAP